MLFLGMGKKNRSNKKKGNRSKSRSASPPPPPKKKPEPVAAPAPVEAVEAPVVEAPVAAPAPAVEPVPPKAAVVDVDNLQKEPEKPAVVAPSPAAPAPAPAPAPTPAPEVTSAPSPAAPVPVSSTEAVGTTAATTVQPATSETQETTPISPLVQEALVSPAAETSVSVALPGQPGSQAVAPEATPVANNKTTTTTTTTTTTALNTSTNTSTMSNPRVTFEHLNLIEQAGAATNQEDTQTAVADMHAKIKEAEGNLGSLNANQYAFTFTPLKEAIWFQRKGQFAIGTETNWTLCKLFHAVKHNASTLSTLNLPLVDLEDVPNDTTIDSWKTLGYKFENELHNIAFFQCLEALYELVELDSTSTNPNTERRNQLFHRVASFVKIGSRQCFETATPQASSVAPTEPPRFSFQMILKIFEKLQQVGPRADPTGFDWDTMGIDAKDGVEVWKSLATCKRLNLPRQVWWKVLFVLVFDLEPHLLRMNLQLLDKEAIKSFQDFLDDAVVRYQYSLFLYC